MRRLSRYGLGSYVLVSGGGGGGGAMKRLSRYGLGSYVLVSSRADDWARLFVCVVLQTLC